MLSDNLQSLKDNIKAEFANKMISLRPTGDASVFIDIGEALADSIVENIFSHIQGNAEIGTVTSSVSGSSATQNNTGVGLIR